MLNKMKTITHTRTKRGTNCYGEIYTSKRTYHDYMDDNKVVCTLLAQEVYGETAYYFYYPRIVCNSQYVLSMEFKNLDEATEYAENYYLQQYKNNPNRLYIKAI